jgi:hypothetical protein
MSDILVVGIGSHDEIYAQGSFRDHPFPQLPNFKIVDWSDQETIKKADVLMQTNIKECKLKNLETQYEYIRNSGKPFLVTEGAVFRQNMKTDSQAYHRWSWFHYFQDEGEYCNQDCPSDRWEQISLEQNLKIEPWQNNPDGHILLCLQRPGDSSLHRILTKKKQDYKHWIWKTVRDIRRYTDRKIVIRIHPLRQDATLNMLFSIDEVFKNIEISTDITGATTKNGSNGGDGITNDLKGAYCAIGLNSNVLTETVMAGIPTFSLCSGSMAWPVSNHFIKDINSPIMEFDRTQWLYNLSYCQWRQDEIEQGLPWEHLKKKLPELIRK